MVTSQRTLRWTDPVELADAARGMSGSEFFTAWKAGDLIPPMAATLGFELADFFGGPSRNRLRSLRLPLQPVRHGLRWSRRHLIDTATGCAVHTRLPAGTGYATVNLTSPTFDRSP
jgi:hypothetical protein